MRKILFSLIALGLFLISPIAFGAVGVNENGTYQGEATTLDMPSAWVDSYDGSTATIGGEGLVVLPLADFVITASGTPALGSQQAYADAASKPGLEIDNNMLALVWADGETSYAQVTFRVPADYASGGAFRILTDQSNDLSKCEIDFEVWVQSAVGDDATAWSVAHTDETRVARTHTGGGSPEEVTLTPTNTITANDIVTLNFWRSDADTGTNANATADLEVYYVEFYYSRN